MLHNPSPMSRKRLALLTAGTSATLAIGGVTYLMAQVSQPMIDGDRAAPNLVIEPTTQPANPVMPGAPAILPVTRPATQPARPPIMLGKPGPGPITLTTQPVEPNTL